MSEKRYAILIGINDYQTQALCCCDADVAKLSARLVSNCRFDTDDVYPIVSTVAKPNDNILTEFYNALGLIREKFQDGDTLLFYFSGHGQASANGLVLEIKEELLSFQSIYEQLTDVPAKQTLFIIDACHAGAGAELKSSDLAALNDYYNERLAVKSGGLQILCSCQSPEKSRAYASLGSSIYTYYLLQAIDNRSFYDREFQTLSLTNMHEYATKRIELAGDPQTPFLITRSAGTYPFAYLGAEKLSGCEVVLNIHKEDEVYSFLERTELNLPDSFKRDFSQFMAELSLNLFNHNFSKGFNLIFNQNTIEIHDHSDQSFDPFTAELTAEGQGVRVYRRFLAKYQGRLTASYISGKPNIIRLEFADSIFLGRPADPCYLAVSEQFLQSLTPLNQHNFDVDCDTLTIDISRSHFPLSICVKMFDELIRRTERKQPLIVIKLAHDDMLRQDVASQIRFRGYDRILLLDGGEDSYTHTDAQTGPDMGE